MKQHTNNNGLVIVLEKNEELVSSLNSLAKTKQLTSAWLVSGLGGADRAIIAFYDPSTKQYIDKSFTEPLEIISLNGNLSWVDDEPFWHIHATLSGSDYKAVSGHVKQLRIGLTGELLIMPLESRLGRNFDEKTGLKLLD